MHWYSTRGVGARGLVLSLIIAGHWGGLPCVAAEHCNDLVRSSGYSLPPIGPYAEILIVSGIITVVSAAAYWTAGPADNLDEVREADEVARRGRLVYLSEASAVPREEVALPAVFPEPPPVDAEGEIDASEN